MFDHFWSISDFLIKIRNVDFRDFSGKIDFVRGNKVSSVDLAIPENIKINHVTNKEKYIYVSSTEGVYVIDAENKSVKERYEYFYDPNDKVNVSFLNFSKNKIYVISNEDIFFSDINSNYKDFRNFSNLSKSSL